MPPFLPHYGPTEGPLGFPMPDRQARQLDTLLKALPKSKEHAYRKTVTAKAPTELNPGERSDVSWITTESVDRMQEVVIARGMNDSQFQANPLVTIQHAYHLPPVGKSLWRKRVKDGDLVGIKAKTQYPAKPDAWVEGDPWPPDKVLSLVQAGLLNGKSIGFLPLKVHFADEKSREKYNFPQETLAIDEWLLLEYAVCFLPMKQDALVESVSKGAVELPDAFVSALSRDRSCQPLAGASAWYNDGMKASLRLLLSGVIDYAGLFPPAGLPLDRAIGRYLQHLREPEAWMLGRFVIQAANLERLTPYAGADAIQPLPVAALGRGGDGRAALLEAWAADHDAIARFGASPGPFVVEAVELRGPPDPQTASATAAAVAGEGLEAFYEVLLVGDWHGRLVGTAEALAAFNARPRRRRAGLKLRCGGPEASAFPTVEHIAFAIRACRDAGVPMKFTAGLHHPLRRFDAGLRTHMHGFVNVFVAGVLAHARRLGEDDLRRVLADEDPAAFVFTDDGLRWREFSASTAEIAVARTDFVTSFGSCSFDEPRADLRALGWM